MTAEEAIKHLKLIVDNEAYADHFQDVCRTAIEALEKVEEYKRFEEQGLLLRLPVKVGDMAYRVNNYHNHKYVYGYKIHNIEIRKDKIIFYDIIDNYFYLSDFGKTVFLTREEAEKKLQELQKNE